jgi:hypothetical protein
LGLVRRSKLHLLFPLWALAHSLGKLWRRLHEKFNTQAINSVVLAGVAAARWASAIPFTPLNQELGFGRAAHFSPFGMAFTQHRAQCHF